MCGNQADPSSLPYKADAVGQGPQAHLHPTLDTPALGSATEFGMNQYSLH